jgi:predicted Zn-dependent protease
MDLAHLGQSYAAVGNRQEAPKILDHLHDLSKQQYVTPYFLARIYLPLGRKEQALHSLEAGYVERTSSLVFVKLDARLHELRGEARFQDLLRRMNFPARFVIDR